MENTRREMEQQVDQYWTGSWRKVEEHLTLTGQFSQQRIGQLSQNDTASPDFATKIIPNNFVSINFEHFYTHTFFWKQYAKNIHTNFPLTTFGCTREMPEYGHIFTECWASDDSSIACRQCGEFRGDAPENFVTVFVEDRAQFSAVQLQCALGDHSIQRPNQRLNIEIRQVRVFLVHARPNFVTLFQVWLCDLNGERHWGGGHSRLGFGDVFVTH